MVFGSPVLSSDVGTQSCFGRILSAGASRHGLPSTNLSMTFGGSVAAQVSRVAFRCCALALLLIAKITMSAANLVCFGMSTVVVVVVEFDVSLLLLLTVTGAG